MTDTLTDSYCERCGARFTFSPPPARMRGARGVRVLAKGFKNFVMSDSTSLDDALSLARADVDRDATSRLTEEFHRTFNFCMSCRQYTCGNCWNEEAGACLSCAPLPEAEPIEAGEAAVAALPEGRPPAGPVALAATEPDSLVTGVGARPGDLAGGLRVERVEGEPTEAEPPNERAAVEPSAAEPGEPVDLVEEVEPAAAETTLSASPLGQLPAATSEIDEIAQIDEIEPALGLEDVVVAEPEPVASEPEPVEIEPLAEAIIPDRQPVEASADVGESPIASSAGAAQPPALAADEGQSEQPSQLAAALEQPALEPVIAVHDRPIAEAPILLAPVAEAQIAEVPAAKAPVAEPAPAQPAAPKRPGTHLTLSRLLGRREATREPGAAAAPGRDVSRPGTVEPGDVSWPSPTPWTERTDREGAVPLPLARAEKPGRASPAPPADGAAGDAHTAARARAAEPPAAAAQTAPPLDLARILAPKAESRREGQATPPAVKPAAAAPPPTWSVTPVWPIQGNAVEPPATPAPRPPAAWAAERSGLRPASGAGPRATAPGASGVWAESASQVLDRSGIRACPNCALPLSPTARFCRRCGTPQSPTAD